MAITLTIGRKLKNLWLLLILGVFFLPLVVIAQDFESFNDFISQYAAVEPKQRQSLVQQFIEWQQKCGGFPIAEADGNVVFFYLSSADTQQVNLTGDFLPISHFNPYWSFPGEPMEHVRQVFYARRTFEPDALLDYMYVVDGKSIVDPLNTRTIFSGTGGGGASELVMPEHQLHEEISERIGTPKGTLVVVEESWADPKVTIYLPPSYNPDKRYPVLYTADGSAWIEFIRLPTILDNLIADEAISPLIAVMIDAAKDRSSWYQYNPAYIKYLERVVQYVDEHFPTQAISESRVHAGASAGGRASVYVGLERPDLFRNVALLSPSFSGPVYYLEPYFSETRRPPENLSVWMNTGTYEGAIYDDVQTMQAYFKRVGVSTVTAYHHHGHSFGAWQMDAVEFIRYFFPRETKK